MIFRHLLNMRSHPTWVRGLKHPVMAMCRSIAFVAPYMGAWIETYSHNRNPHSYHVLLIVTHRLKQYKPEMCKPQIICIGFYRCCL